MIPRTATSSNSIPTWLVVVLAAAWIVPGLVGHEPWKPDEAYSFGLVYHILQTGDWVVPTLAGEPFVEKPPLFYLTAALFAKIFSGALPLHDGAHLAAGFYMALTLLFTGLAARELYGRGIVAVLALLACLGLAPWAHLLITDTALLAGLALGFYGFALGRRRHIAGGLLLGTGAGMAFLAKGLVGPGLLGLLALSLPLLASAWRTHAYLWMLLTAFALTFLVLVFAADARQVYALPLLLPLALLAVPAVEQLPRRMANGLYLLGVIAGIAVIALVWISWSALEFGTPAWWLSRLEPETVGGGASAPPLAVAVATGYTVAALFAFRVLRRMREGPVAAWAAVMTLVMGLSMTLLLGWLDERKGYHRVFVGLKQAMPDSYRCVASHGLGEPQRAMLHYYTGIKTHRLAVSPETNCDLLLRQEWVTDEAHDPRAWRVLWEGRRPNDTNEKFRLYQRY